MYNKKKNAEKHKWVSVLLYNETAQIREWEGHSFRLARPRLNFVGRPFALGSGQAYPRHKTMESKKPKDFYTCLLMLLLSVRYLV